MTIEVPVLRLGLAGYTEAQQKIAADVAAAAASGRARWAVGAFSDADGWWLEGSRTVLLPAQHLRVQPAVPTGHSVKIALADVDRPVAVSHPINAANFKPALSFTLGERDAGVRVLHQFADFLNPMLSQFALASSIAEHQPSFSSGSWEVLRGSELLAVVDLRLGTGVLPGVKPEDFAEASWCIRDHGAVRVPPDYLRGSVSQLMWQYAQRTERDLLPPHYRNQPLYFRRPPRLSSRQLKDAHLLVMRELVANAGMNFSGLQQSTGLAADPLAKVLSALYVVGSITSNPKRALAQPMRSAIAARESSLSASEQNVYQSLMDSSPRPPNLPRLSGSDKTAPLPLMPDR